MNCPNCKGLFDIDVHFDYGHFSGFEYNDQVRFRCPSCQATFQVKREVTYQILTDTLETKEQHQTRREKEKLESLERVRINQENERKLKERKQKQLEAEINRDTVSVIWHWKRSNENSYLSNYYFKFKPELNKKTVYFCYNDIIKNSYLYQLVKDFEAAKKLYVARGLFHYHLTDLNHVELLQLQKEKNEEKAKVK